MSSAFVDAHQISGPADDTSKGATRGVHMDFRRFLSFAAKFTVAHVVSSVAYQLLTKSFYEGSNPVFSTFMATRPNRNFGNM